MEGRTQRIFRVVKLMMNTCHYAFVQTRGRNNPESEPSDKDLPEIPKHLNAGTHSSYSHLSNECEENSNQMTATELHQNDGLVSIFVEGRSQSCGSRCHGSGLVITSRRYLPARGDFRVYKTAHRTWLRM